MCSAQGGRSNIERVLRWLPQAMINLRGTRLGAPVADPGKLHLLQPPNPFCGEPPAVITDALIVHPDPQAVESALIGRHAPVAVLLMERMQFGQPLRPHSVLLGLTLPHHIPDKTDIIESAQLLTAQTACPIQSAHLHDPPAQIDVLRPFRRHVAMAETAAEFPQTQKAALPARVKRAARLPIQAQGFQAPPAVLAQHSLLLQAPLPLHPSAEAAIPRPDGRYPTMTEAPVEPRQPAQHSLPHRVPVRGVPECRGTAARNPIEADLLQPPRAGGVEATRPVKHPLVANPMAQARMLLGATRHLTVAVLPTIRFQLLESQLPRRVPILLFRFFEPGFRSPTPLHRHKYIVLA